MAEELTIRNQTCKKDPIAEEDGNAWFYDAEMPDAERALGAGVQRFFGIPGPSMRGVDSLKRYTKFDYANKEIVTSGEPILLEGGVTVPLEVRSRRWLIKMTVSNVEGWRYIDADATFPYVHNLLP